MTGNGKLHHHVSINLCVPNHTGVKETRLMPMLIKVIGGLDSARKALKRRRLNISLEIHEHSMGLMMKPDFFEGFDRMAEAQITFKIVDDGR